MRTRYSEPSENSDVDTVLKQAVNLISVIYAKIYFPTFSNSLKEIGQSLGCRWTDTDATGSASIVWRHQWEATQSNDLRQKLITYNAEDCLALSVVSET